MLIALRFVVGLGLGGELPVASTLVSEYAPKKIRGRVVVALEAFWALGWIMAALIGYPPHPHSPRRLALGARHRPRSGRLCAVRPVGPARVRPVPRVEGPPPRPRRPCGFLEDAAGVAPVPSPDEAPAKHHGTESIWAPELRGRTIALWLVWFCINLSYYGAFIWIPSLLHNAGFTLVKSFQFTLIITLAQLPGYAVAAWLIEVWGRRLTLALFLAGSAVAALGFGLANTETLILVTGCLLSFFNPARGARCTPSGPSSTRPPSAAQARAQRRRSDALPRSSRHSSFRC